MAQELRIPAKGTVWATGASSEIRIEHLPKVSLQYKSCTKLFRGTTLREAFMEILINVNVFWDFTLCKFGCCLDRQIGKEEMGRMCSAHKNHYCLLKEYNLQSVL